MESSRNKFIKFMSLTHSSNDGEAINALRMAQKFLDTNDLRWPDIIYWPPEVLENENEITLSKIKKCLEKVFGKPREFLLSLEEQVNKGKSLSEKQINALEKFYANAINR